MNIRTKKLHPSRPQLFLLLVVLLSSCSPYRSSTITAPLFTDSGDLMVSGYASASGVGGQAAVAFTDHLALAGNYQELNWSSASLNNTFNYSILEGGMGYFGNLVRAQKDTLMWECFVGYGSGSIFYNDRIVAFPWGVWEEQFRANFQRWYIQPSLGYSGQYIDLAFTPRFSFVNYLNTREIINIEPVSSNFWTTHFEPTITVRGGYRNFRLQLQGGYMIPLKETDYDHLNLLASAGITFKLGRRYPWPKRG